MNILISLMMVLGIGFSVDSQAATADQSWAIVENWLANKYTNCGSEAQDSVHMAVIGYGGQKKLSKLQEGDCADPKSTECAAAFEKEFGSRVSARAEQQGCQRMSDEATPASTKKPAVN